MDHETDPSRDDALDGSCDEEEPLLSTLLALPRVGNDFWLGMQARNLAMSNVHIVQVERQVYDEYWESDKSVTPTTMLLSALTQMWVIALYELIRTSLEIPRDVSEGEREELSAAADRAKEALREPRASLNALRMSLAKHQRSGREKQRAFMPGYVRIDGGTGGVEFQWQKEGRKVVYEDGSIEDTGATYFTSRRSLVLGLIAAAAALRDES